MPIGGSNVGTGYVPIKPDTKGFGRELERGLDREGTGAARRSGEKIAQAAKVGFLGGAALIGKGVFDFAGFDKQMREVFTLMPDISQQAMGEMTEQVKDFSTEFGVLPTETIPALYEALGAGVPADNVFSFLETSQKLAKGGVTDLATAVDGLSTVVNSYGADVITAEQASDVMFNTVKLGKGTVDEISNSLYNVVPVAAQFGVSFEEVGAAIAALTAKGVPAAQATTQIRAAVAELGKDGTKASKEFEAFAGKSFPEFIAAGGDLQNAFQIINDAASESGKSVIDMFGSIEAGSAVAPLVKDSVFFDFLQQMEDGAGATDKAFETMNTGISATLDKLKARFSVSLINIGESIAPSIEAAGLVIIGLLDLFNKLPGSVQAGTVVIGPMTLGIVAMAKPILNAITLFGKLGKVFTLLAANPWIIVLAGLVTITILIIRNWDTVKQHLSTIWNGLQIAGRAVAFGLSTAWSTATGAVMSGLTSLGSTASSVMTGVQSVIASTGQFVSSVFTGIVASIGSAWSTVTSLTSSAWSTVSSIVTGVGGAVVDFIVGIPNAITGAFGGLADVISAPFVAAFGAIKATWNATVGGFGFEVPSWIPILGGNSFTIPSMARGGILAAPQLFMGGDYPDVARNPEIVAPQRLMRETVREAITQAGPGSGGFTVNGNLVNVEHMTVRNDRDIERFARELDRRIEREARAQGRPIVRTAS